LSSGKASESSVAISYAVRPDVAPEAERSTLANVYKFVLDCRTSKGTATSPVSRPVDAKGSKHVRARDSIPKRS
jgi:hypothetical protein